MIYRARAAQLGYGRPVGILVLEEHIPCPPGTPGNPTTFQHPVCYEVVKGAGVEALALPVSPEAALPFLAAGNALVERGAAAIIGNCGLMIVHQATLAAELPVPVFLSSLLLVPLIARSLAAKAKIGVVASSHRSFRTEHLRLAGIGPEIATAVATMDGRPHFQAAVVDQSGQLDSEKVEAEVVEVARDLVAQHPETAAIILECVDLPPYAAAVQEAVGLPVFDITSLVGFAVSGLVRRPFVGIY
jgi:Asp/Glu/hydantoin racemase